MDKMIHSLLFLVLFPTFIADPNSKHRHTIDFMLKTKAFKERYILDESPEVRNLRFTNPPFHLSSKPCFELPVA